MLLKVLKGDFLKILQKEIINFEPLLQKALLTQLQNVLQEIFEFIAEHLASSSHNNLYQDDGSEELPSEE